MTDIIYLEALTVSGFEVSGKDDGILINHCADNIIVSNRSRYDDYADEDTKWPILQAKSICEQLLIISIIL